MNELEALTVLSAIPLVGPVKVRLLVGQFGSACAALNAPLEEIADLPGFGAKVLMGWRSWQKDKAWQRNLDLVEQHGVKLVAYNDPSYPRRLKDFPDAPSLLYVKGELKACDQESVAIIGTRNATPYGLAMAEKTSKELAQQGFTIISGLARGIDTAAHRGALRNGRTIAVIGSGLADIYPRENHALAEEIAVNGAVVSEFPMLAPPDRLNFPQRNRIVSGMSKGILLIEAPISSGAMLTMKIAKRQGNRDLFAMPGRADCPSFRGNFALIKAGDAALVENGKDVGDALTGLFSVCGAPAPKKAGPPLEPEELQLLQLLPAEEVSIDTIASQTKMPIAKLNVLLMSLLLKQKIREYPGRLYRKELE